MKAGIRQKPLEDAMQNSSRNQSSTFKTLELTPRPAKSALPGMQTMQTSRESEKSKPGNAAGQFVKSCVVLPEVMDFVHVRGHGD
jgi:hypothetical protein